MNNTNFEYEVRNRANNKCQATGCWNTLDTLECYKIVNSSDSNNPANGLLLRADIIKAINNGILELKYNYTTRKIYLECVNNIKLSSTYLEMYETRHNIINLNIKDEYFEDYCKYIYMRLND